MAWSFLRRKILTVPSGLVGIGLFKSFISSCVSFVSVFHKIFSLSSCQTVIHDILLIPYYPPNVSRVCGDISFFMSDTCILHFLSWLDAYLFWWMFQALEKIILSAVRYSVPWISFRSSWLIYLGCFVHLLYLYWFYLFSYWERCLHLQLWIYLLLSSISGYFMYFEACC